MSDPLPPSAALPLKEGENALVEVCFIVPLLRGTAAEGGRGALTHLTSLRHISLSQEFLHFINRRDPAAGADLRALHGGNGVREADDILHCPILQKTVNESAVEDVAGAGCVGDGYFERG